MLGADAGERSMIIRGLAGAKTLLKKKSVGNVAMVATGAGVSQMIAILFSPLITRLYGPEAFGQLGTFITISGVIAPVAAMAYPIAIVLPKSDREAKAIAHLSIRIALCLSALFAVIVVLAGRSLAELLSLQAVEGYLILLPVVLLVSAVGQTCHQWLIRKKMFAITAKISILMALLVGGVKSGLGLLWPLASVLILVDFASSAVRVLLLTLGARKANVPQHGVTEEYGRQCLCKLGRKYYDFPLYRAPQMLLSTLSQGLPILMLAAFFGPASAGHYFLGKRLLGMPLGLIGRSVGDVFYPRISDAAHGNESIRRLILKTTLGLGAVGVIPVAVLVIAGPWLFGAVFGSEWTMAGSYSRWLAPWMFLLFLNNPSVKAVPVLSMQRFLLVFSLITISLRSVGLAAGYLLFNSDLVAVALFAIAGTITNIFLIAIVLSKSRHYDNAKGLAHVPGFGYTSTGGESLSQGCDEER